jgi:hypothetical protein
VNFIIELIILSTDIFLHRINQLKQCMIHINMRFNRSSSSWSLIILLCIGFVALACFDYLSVEVRRGELFSFVLKPLSNLFEASKTAPFHAQHPLLALHHLNLHLIHLEDPQFRHIFDELGHHCNMVAGKVDFDQIWKLFELRGENLHLVEIHFNLLELSKAFNIGRD